MPIRDRMFTGEIYAATSKIGHAVL